MPNINAPFGFRHFRGNGSAPTYEQVEFPITSTAPAIYFGDPVVAQADGSIAAPTASSGNTPAALGLAGIFQGCKYLSIAQKRVVWSNYWPGSDAVAGSVKGYVVNDPNAQFVAQSDATGAALVDVNATVGFIFAAGNAFNGISAYTLDMAGANLNVANNPFRIVAIINDPPGAQGTLSNGQPYDWAVVAFNNVNSRNFTGV
jgi:hypothetical protein